jgi:hypothetical protein
MKMRGSMRETFNHMFMNECIVMGYVNSANTRVGEEAVKYLFHKHKIVTHKNFLIFCPMIYT